MKKKIAIIIAAVIALPLLFILSCVLLEDPPVSRLACQVWSENSPYGERTEFKVNWIRLPGNITTQARLVDCWLYAVDAVKVTAPDGSTHDLARDFNINAYSGEVTQRWVLYGARGFALPPTGEYTFKFYRDGRASAAKTVRYTRSVVGFPTGLRLSREGQDLRAAWTPPPGIARSMWYKVLVFSAEGSSGTPVSKVFAWDSTDVKLPDVPLVAGQKYHANVALFFSEGYAYSRLVYFTWDEPLAFFEPEEWRPEPGTKR